MELAILIIVSCVAALLLAIVVIIGYICFVVGKDDNIAELRKKKSNDIKCYLYAFNKAELEKAICESKIFDNIGCDSD